MVLVFSLTPFPSVSFSRPWGQGLFLLLVSPSLSCSIVNLFDFFHFQSVIRRDRKIYLVTCFFFLLINSRICSGGELMTILYMKIQVNLCLIFRAYSDLCIYHLVASSSCTIPNGSCPSFVIVCCIRLGCN